MQLLTQTPKWGRLAAKNVVDDRIQAEGIIHRQLELACRVALLGNSLQWTLRLPDGHANTRICDYPNGTCNMHLELSQACVHSHIPHAPL